MVSVGKGKITVTQKDKRYATRAVGSSVSRAVGGGLVGGLIGGLVSGALEAAKGCKPEPEGWSGICGKADPKIDDIVIAVAERLQQLLEQPEAAPVPVPAQEPVQPYVQAAPVAASILCTSGPFAGATFPVNGRLLIGHDPAYSHVIFPPGTEGISALHCEVGGTPQGVILTDKGSTYGTFLSNGRKLNANESVPLMPGEGFYLADRRNAFQVV
jgi:hypothetical protein